MAGSEGGGTEKRPAGVTVGHLCARPVRGPRADGRWYWRCEHRADGGRETIWAGWGTRAEATQALARVVVGVAEPRASGEVVTVRDLLEIHAGARAERPDLSPRTIRAEQQGAARLLSDLGAVRLDRLSARDLERARDARLRSGSSARTVRYDLQVLAAAWRWARSVGAGPDRDPPRVAVRLPKQDAPTPSLVEIAQLVAWLEARRAGSAWAPRAVRILAATGCRIGEIEALTWGDLDLGRRVLRVRTGKTGARLVPLTAGVCAQITSWGPGHPDARVLGVAVGTVRSNLDRALRAACVALGFPGYRS